MTKKILTGVAGFLIAAIAFFFLLTALFPPAKPEIKASDVLSNPAAAKSFYLTALGDSLTEGVGDVTGEGGFVPLLAKEIDNNGQYDVTFDNFGKAGDTSEQIMARLTAKGSKQPASLKRADMITLTVGGNDVMHALSKNLANLTVKSFDKPRATYKKSLTKLLTAVRRDNPTAPIYVLGIYNPFYLQFKGNKNLQTIFTKWNQATQSVVKSQSNVHFVPVANLLENGLDGSQANASSNSSSSTITNNALSKADEFHPNNAGYQLMANAVYKAYKETK